MSPVFVTCWRTIGLARNIYSTGLTALGFLAVAAASFSLALVRHDGDSLPVVVLMATCVSPILPVLASLLSMDVWSEERRTGRVDLLLTAAVDDRDLVLGKFFGVWLVVMSLVLTYLLSSAFALWMVSPVAVAGLSPVAFMPALIILGLQCAAWCAVSVALSAMARHASTAFCASVVLLVVLPRGLWECVMLFFGDRRTMLGEMPLDAHVVDFSTGMFSSGVALSYLVVTLVAIFIATKRIYMLRCLGRKSFASRCTSIVVMLMSLFAAALTTVLAMRFDFSVDLMPAGSSSSFSMRTREILSETGGDVTVSAFLPRNDVRFRAVSHFLRSLNREAISVGGAGFNLRFVDPNWDLGVAERLVRRGVVEESIVIEKGRRIAILPIREGFGERVCAAAIRRLLTPPQRHNVYWTIGHGELSYSDYGSFGLSDIARDIAQEGYCNDSIDLSSGGSIPSDCALIVVAGAKFDFSRAELDRLESYLLCGGRLLVLLGQDRSAGVTSMLPAWGVRISEKPIGGHTTVDGSDFIVSEFSEHMISRPLKGARVVMERPVAFVASSAVGSGIGRLDFTAVASVGADSVVVAVSRGSEIGSDLAIRPSRIVAVGDSGFVTNAALASRANANRDFFLNCISYLSGTDSSGSSGTETRLLTLGMDRRARIVHICLSAVAMPLLVFLIMFAVAFRRRRRI